MMMYSMDLPRSQYELCEICPSDIDLPTEPPARCFSRQLLGYLFELRVRDSDYPRLLDLKMCVMEQLAGADRNAEILRRIHVMFPVVMRVGGSLVTLSPMFLRLLRDRLVILMNTVVRRRQRPLPPPLRRPIPAVIPAAPRPRHRQVHFNRHVATAAPAAAALAAKKRQKRSAQSWSLFDVFNIFPMMLKMVRDWFNNNFNSKYEIEYFDSSDDEISM